MKKTKKLLIGFMFLWVIGFLIIWGITVLKKLPVKKMAVPDVATEPDMSSGELNSRSSPASEAVAVRCYKVALIDFRDDLPVMGTVRGALKIELKFEVNGVIESINFREGDVIYKGDPIASLNKQDAQLKVDYSKSKLESSKVQYLASKKKLEIHQKLYKIGGIIKAKLEEVELEAKSQELQVESAKVELKSAKAEFEKTDLYAPRDGVLGSRDAEVGEFVTPQNKIATLYDTMDVFVELGIVERDIDKIALGQDVTVTVDAYPGMEFTGTVDNVFPIIEGKSRTLTVRVGIQNLDALLLPGMFARAVITVAEFENAIVIPSMSLNKLDTGYEVFFVDRNNTAQSRPVEVAYVTTDYTVVSSGLYEDELVITDAPQELKSGLPVNIIDVEEVAQDET
ncbi:efflux RND transporter periplasmic adaptor subunit [Candidatus Omnitrophota bacterium]